MFLSRWLSRLGHANPCARRVSTTTRNFRPTLESLETREVPAVSIGPSFWAPAPPVAAMLREMDATPFGASADGERPLTRLQALTQSAKQGRLTTFVYSGQSIQSALDAAKPGTTIFIDPGTYREALRVHTADVRLVGLTGAGGSHVTLLSPGGSGDGVSVEDAADGFAMRFIEVRGFQGDGVHLDRVDNFRLTHLLLTNDRAGIDAVNSNGGIIQFTEEQGHKKAGIALENSVGTLVRFNRAHGNVAGVELIGSSHVQVMNNAVFDNTAGILVSQSTSNMIAANYVYSNNHVNFAAPGSLESTLVQGTGVQLVGADRSLVLGNLVTGNQTMGIGVFGGSAGKGNWNLLALNWAMGNGFHSMSESISGADLLWDGLGQGNQWMRNTFGTSH